MALKRICDITGTDRDVEICDVTIAGQAIKMDLSPVGAARLREFFGAVVTVSHPLESPAGEADGAQDADDEASAPVQIPEQRTAAEPQSSARQAAAESMAQRSARGGRKPASVKARQTKVVQRAAISTMQETSDIRAWARENGFEIRDRGAIPGRIRSAYVLAHE